MSGALISWFDAWPLPLPRDGADCAGGIFGKLARIGIEVLVRAELQRVDEDGHDHAVVVVAHADDHHVVRLPELRSRHRLIVSHCPAPDRAP